MCDGEGLVAETQAAGHTASVVGKQREVNAGPQVAVPLFVQRGTPVCGWCCPHSGVSLPLGQHHTEEESVSFMIPNPANCRDATVVGMESQVDDS